MYFYLRNKQFSSNSRADNIYEAINNGFEITEYNNLQLKLTA